MLDVRDDDSTLRINLDPIADRLGPHGLDSLGNGRIIEVSVEQRRGA